MKIDAPGKGPSLSRTIPVIVRSSDWAIISSMLIVVVIAPVVWACSSSISIYDNSIHNVIIFLKSYFQFTFL